MLINLLNLLFEMFDSKVEHLEVLFAKDSVDQIVQRFQKGHDNYDCPLCGSVMTPGKWSSDYDQLLQDVGTYMIFLKGKGIDISKLSIWMEIKDNWCVVMVDANDFEIAGQIQFFGLHDSQKYEIFTEAYSMHRAMLTRDIER